MDIRMVWEVPLLLSYLYLFLASGHVPCSRLRIFLVSGTFEKLRPHEFDVVQCMERRGLPSAQEERCCIASTLIRSLLRSVRDALWFHDAERGPCGTRLGTPNCIEGPGAVKVIKTPSIGRDHSTKRKPSTKPSSRLNIVSSNSGSQSRLLEARRGSEAQGGDLVQCRLKTAHTPSRETRETRCQTNIASSTSDLENPPKKSRTKTENPNQQIEKG